MILSVSLFFHHKKILKVIKLQLCYFINKIEAMDKLKSKIIDLRNYLAKLLIKYKKVRPYTEWILIILIYLEDYNIRHEKIDLSCLQTDLKFLRKLYYKNKMDDFLKKDLRARLYILRNDDLEMRTFLYENLFNQKDYKLISSFL